ncbi:MAG TPA: tRNA (adenosine(37)-N6)-threonylcarbamoyltransferase complex transferase subunit TsaD [Candidatus Udaeobacter sp.]|nr:tRNA (adenosine(37)-N6)-threonylcarbamoyltransferase complex transferase subunit TsaD [Candidatus Udaeobacter sp.]
MPTNLTSRDVSTSLDMTVLALETSCDETAVAILRKRDQYCPPELLASEVASQIAAHEKFGGIVPEIASRNHLIYAPQLLDRAIHKAGIAMSSIDAFAATSGPGLASSLMIGASIGKGLSVGFAKPYLAINHLEGHLLSPFFGRGDSDREITRNVSLIVSGGHTMLVRVRALSDYQVIGRTVDDAAGEAFDKVAKMLGLGYPGGPEIEKRARGGDPHRFDLPRSMPRSENFSFSGLKTAVRYLLPKISVIPSRKDGEGPHTRSLDRQVKTRDQSSSERSFAFAQDDKLLADLCASFQQAIIDVLVSKTIAAAQKYGVELVTLSGGVSCNEELRRQLQETCSRNGFECKTADAWLCTDNAAMIAFAALLRLEAGFRSQITDEIDPNLPLVR